MAIPFNIKYNNLESSSMLEQFVTKHLAKLDRIVDDNDEAARADIELSREQTRPRKGEVYSAEINLHTSHGEFHALEKSDDIRKAIDLLRDRIVREVKSSTRKFRDLRRRGARSIKQALTNTA